MGAMEGDRSLDAISKQSLWHPADLAADARHIRYKVAGLDLFSESRPRHVFDPAAADSSNDRPGHVC
jgi:hypothetical protein